MFNLENHFLDSTGAALPGEISKQVLCSVISLSHLSCLSEALNQWLVQPSQHTQPGSSLRPSA
jgi:hypothetical protein